MNLLVVIILVLAILIGYAAYKGVVVLYEEYKHRELIKQYRSGDIVKVGILEGVLVRWDNHSFDYQYQDFTYTTRWSQLTENISYNERCQRKALHE
jgi:hypothetical protein